MGIVTRMIRACCTRIELILSGTFTGSVFGGSVYRIGANVPLTGCHHGYIDEVRITKGIARYTSNFTVPDKEFSL